MPLSSQEALDGVVAARFHDRRRTDLRPTLTPELIAEHERQPFGQHSDALRRVLTYLGSFSIEGKLVVEYDGDERWYVSRFTTTQAGLRTERVAGPHPTVGAAVHAVFLSRVRLVFGVAA
ncbi:conserved hypothetical protein [Parafrankia sp. EAN1pec]|uniref:hypothetical protein n=1 Tax=Parafrankia sp. (strain EAN1pec) TaxID=298653 RepID=UPI000054375B|nr:conserved hypothetical protein [Frankia sp. EAN1pec]